MDRRISQAFIQPFFQKTLGFWVLLLLVGGVLMEFKQHLQIARFLVNHPSLLVLTAVGFILYTWVHLRILLGLIRSPKYLIFHHLGLLSKKDSRNFWTSVFLTNHSPAVAYFLFLLFIGWEQNQLPGVLILGVIYLSGLMATGLKIQQILKLPIKEAWVERPNLRRPIPRFTWIFFHLKNHRPLLFLLSKLVSLVLLNGFFFTYLSGDYDFRWLQFGVLCVSFVQFFLLIEKSNFERLSLSWTLTLPFSIFKKSGNHLGNFVLIIGPELLFLAWRGGNELQAIDTSSLIIFLISLLMGIYGLILQKSESSQFHFWIFGGFALLFLSILFGVPWYLVASLNAFGLLGSVRNPYQV